MWLLKGDRVPLQKPVYEQKQIFLNAIIIFIVNVNIISHETKSFSRFLAHKCIILEKKKSELKLR